ncbi:hypothetical protein [Paracoccus sp. SM22M-07]|uniref:hypothetical protein n=1 Tax=Paracoccus sp. SM22M-07 TaxID=1520813 RepID=UPI00091D062B|nr:hypothetical protein [Paracoccus sp. SM22M-07]OJH45452.1 hypothetical protein IE00_03690 [Paracoccus sp. SM22M-07]
MIRKLIPIALPVLALVGGAFGGDMLRAPADPPTHEAAAADDHAAPADDHAPAPDDHAAASDDHGGGDDHAAAGEDGWFTFPTQFFVPLVRQGDMGDLMIITLTLQTDGASLEALRKKEHALRDALLRQLLIHANTGGFDGNFTADRNLVVLRQELAKAATGVTDLPIKAVLIEDIARQQG